MRHWAGIGWLALFVVACGGAAKEPEGPADVDAESESSGAASGDSDGDEDSVRKAAGTPSDAVGDAPRPAAQNADDAVAVLQLVLNDPELDSYLKLGEPGRFPLKIAGKSLPSGELTKSNEPVKVVAGPANDKDAVLVFTDIEITGKKATVRYRYAIEGVRGSANLTKGQFGWELTNSRIVEHK